MQDSEILLEILSTLQRIEQLLDKPTYVVQPVQVEMTPPASPLARRT